MVLLSVERVAQARVVRLAGGCSQPPRSSVFHSSFPAKSPPTAAELQHSAGVGQEFVEFRKTLQF